jgi:hypothetical protein
VAYTLTTEQQRLVLRLDKLGWDWKQIARAAGCSVDAARWVRPYEQRRPMDWTPALDAGAQLTERRSRSGWPQAKPSATSPGGSPSRPRV